MWMGLSRATRGTVVVGDLELYGDAPIVGVWIAECRKAGRYFRVAEVNNVRQLVREEPEDGEFRPDPTIVVKVPKTRYVEIDESGNEIVISGPAEPSRPPAHLGPTESSRPPNRPGPTEPSRRAILERIEAATRIPFGTYPIDAPWGRLETTSRLTGQLRWRDALVPKKRAGDLDSGPADPKFVQDGDDVVLEPVNVKFEFTAGQPTQLGIMALADESGRNPPVVRVNGAGALSVLPEDERVMEIVLAGDRHTFYREGKQQTDRPIFAWRRGVTDLIEAGKPAEQILVLRAKPCGKITNPGVPKQVIKRQEREEETEVGARSRERAIRQRRK
jgi:hypothetical protein